MGPDRYLPFLPTILNWIQQTLDAHAGERRAVSSFKFSRLPRYFSTFRQLPGLFTSDREPSAPDERKRHGPRFRQVRAFHPAFGPASESPTNCRPFPKSCSHHKMESRPVGPGSSAALR